MVQQTGEYLIVPGPASPESLSDWPLGQDQLTLGDTANQSTLAPAPLVDSDPKRYEAISPPGDVFRKVLDTYTREVIVESEIGVEHYMELARQLGPWAVRDVEFFIENAEALVGKRIEEVNPTANGGGVQMILMSQTNLLRGQGVIDTWRLMIPDEDAFRVTKDWHNTFQGVAQHSQEHLQAGMTVYERWIRDKNTEPFREPFAAADIVTLHDPQPHGMIGLIPEDTPVVWRSHIQNRTDLIETPGSPQSTVWDYVYNGRIDQADAHVYHPVNEFVPHNVPESVINFMPATFDPFDDLNRLDLTEQDKKAGRGFIDDQLSISYLQEPDEAPENEDWEQSKIDWERPIIALIARFDPSKGMPEAVRAYVRAREMMIERGLSEEQIPQLVLLGNGSIDDPDGRSELSKMMRQRSQLDGPGKDDVKVIRVPHNDKAINTLMMEADFGLQPSLFEGFETRASDWIWHSKPVIVSNRGGLPWQVHEGKSGHIIDPEDIEQFAGRITEMTVDRQKYDEMCAWADHLGKTYNYREFSTISGVIRWAILYKRLLSGGPTGDRKWQISELVDGESEQESTKRLLGTLATTA
jgi:glycosyltransferase involved in cell wall biosynthesis